jgi:hypothetical protein
MSTCDEQYIWFVGHEDGFEYGIAFASHSFTEAVRYASDVHHLVRLEMGMFNPYELYQEVPNPWWEEHPTSIQVNHIGPNADGNGRLGIQVFSVVNTGEYIAHQIPLMDMNIWPNDKYASTLNGEMLIERHLPHGTTHDFADQLAIDIEAAIGPEGRQFIEDLEIQQKIIKAGQGAPVAQAWRDNDVQF